MILMWFGFVLMYLFELMNGVMMWNGNCVLGRFNVVG